LKDENCGGCAKLLQGIKPNSTTELDRHGTRPANRSPLLAGTPKDSSEKKRQKTKKGDEKRRMRLVGPAGTEEEGQVSLGVQNSWKVEKCFGLTDRGEKKDQNPQK